MKKKAKRENTFVGSVDINKISLRSCQARKRGIITNYRKVGMKAWSMFQKVEVQVQCQVAVAADFAHFRRNDFWLIFSSDGSKNWIFLREPLLWSGLAIASLRQLPYELTLGFWDFVLGPWNRLPEYFCRFYCLDELIKMGMIPPAKIKSRA